MSVQSDDSDVCMNLANQVIALRNQLRRLGWNTHSSQADDVRRQMIALSLQMDDLGCPPVPVRDPPPLPPPGPLIYGVEKTQAIQFFPVNNQGSGNGDKNSVPMMDSKTTLLRVYVSFYNVNVTGRLQYDSNLPLAEQTPIFPINTAIQAQPYGSISRISISQTLNFIIPANLSTGTRFFSISIGLGADPTTFVDSDRLNDVLQFQFLKPPRVHGVLVHYVGPDTNGQVRDFGTPTVSDFFTMMAQVTRLYPVSGFTNTGFNFVNLSVPGFTPPAPGGLVKGVWDNLASQLEQMRLTSGTNDIYVGLVPGQIPPPPASPQFNAATSDGTLGVGGGGALVATAFANLGYVPLAQEMGHAFNRQHAPCGPAPLPDTNYPTYGSYRAGSIGEVGVSTLNPLQTFDPSTVPDFMGYCPNPWVSPYTYMALITSIRQTQP